MWLLFGRLLALVVVVGSGAFAERGGVLSVFSLLYCFRGHAVLCFFGLGGGGGAGGVRGNGAQ